MFLFSCVPTGFSDLSKVILINAARAPQPSLPAATLMNVEDTFVDEQKLKELQTVTNIVPGCIFISSARCVTGVPQLASIVAPPFSIRSLINLTQWGDAKDYESFFPGQAYYQCRIEDDPNVDFIPVVDRCYPLMERAEKTNQALLVFDETGNSRAASLALAYLMKSRKWTLKQAWDYLRERRRFVSIGYSLTFVNELSTSHLTFFDDLFCFIYSLLCC